MVVEQKAILSTVLAGYLDLAKVVKTSKFLKPKLL